MRKLQLNWTDFKDLVAQKNIEMQWTIVELSTQNLYEIWAGEKNAEYSARIVIEASPSGDQLDFETNYKDYANDIALFNISSSSGTPVIPVYSEDPLPVNIVGSSEPLEVSYEEVLAVPRLTETTIVDYVVPVDSSFLLVSSRATGDTDAEYFLQVDGSKKDCFRTSWCERTANFDFPQGAISVPGGSVVRVRVYHEEDTVTHGSVNFKGSIAGVLN